MGSFDISFNIDKNRVTSELHGFLKESEMQEYTDLLLSQLKAAKKGATLLSDFSDYRITTDKSSFKQAVKNIAQSTNLTAAAIVLPESAIGNLQIKSVGKETEEARIKRNTFQNRENAIKWLDNQV